MLFDAGHHFVHGIFKDSAKSSDVVIIVLGNNAKSGLAFAVAYANVDIVFCHPFRHFKDCQISCFFHGNDISALFNFSQQNMLAPKLINHHYI